METENRRAAWSGWGCQYPGKMPRLYGERRIAELNCDREGGDQLLYFTADLQDGLIGRTVSMDVSTGDHDACHRLFGTVTGVEGRDGVILCELQEDNRDVEPPAPDSEALQRRCDNAELALKYQTENVASLVERLEEAKTGLEWYQQEYPEVVTKCDHEVMERIETTLSAFRKRGQR